LGPKLVDEAGECVGAIPGGAELPDLAAEHRVIGDVRPSLGDELAYCFKE